MSNADADVARDAAPDADDGETYYIAARLSSHSNERRLHTTDDPDECWHLLNAKNVREAYDSEVEAVTICQRCAGTCDSRRDQDASFHETLEETHWSDVELLSDSQ